MLAGFCLRLVTLALRFGCPLLILYLSTDALLGEYYLFTTFFTLVVMLVSLETAVPFSATYLKARSDRIRRLVFAAMTTTQIWLAGALAVPVAVGYAALTSSPSWIAIPLAILIVSEACVNEAGRFFWNIGQASVASRRDLWRAVFFLAAIANSVVLNEEIVTALSLSVLATCNFAILCIEWRRWGRPATGGLRSVAPLHDLRSVWRRIRRSLRVSASQVVHAQVLALQPLLERLMIQDRLGLAVVGGYSFQFALIQAAATLIVLPLAADARRAILGVRNPGQLSRAHRAVLKFSALLAPIMIAAGAGVALALPVIGWILGREIELQVGALLAAVASATAAIFAAAVGPLFAPRGRVLRANTLTLAAMSPLALPLIIPASVVPAAMVVFAAVTTSALAQLAIRILYSTAGTSR
jgi:hypothetical protein